MKLHKIFQATLIGALCLSVAACGGRGKDRPTNTSVAQEFNNDVDAAKSDKSSIWDVFGGKPDQKVQVNRYLWNASIDVLSFLPVQSVDPFTGVIITGYGTPPGGGRSYRATVHIKDPALDARSLNVSLHSKGGPVSASTTRAVEDAILSRARQLRIADKKF
ncbi:DUF3576 domain-containing protein [Phaeobacter gallaeciensis]|jgi:hypothetical protein|uniref:DUF3576 domain-containing protein n=1 Tax=Phaeobacter gallaeciensis TaxID=60890 RepID=UPI00237EFEDC|nr:DUF3576 domain-containing protein [Phaeobacter gallaeciensis]MDE4304933.1 DUF3576 domain-containing protein [Phaeobacter gallaeciensis]MDE4309281.1 DUF3576 domain-containing protein [Phaeobacter gallaeciensis]MDE4313738.1 DUF3576 domain-containing protein [Phaeobacter gallaeciensis]MDE4318284.1 DUF3576 domain-containing protein [Phaeobacter gallaeciensis]MDE4323224.1 DUF3576 domain-containing protein [Phaeobacter gallaeciensis]